MDDRELMEFLLLQDEEDDIVGFESDIFEEDFDIIEYETDIAEYEYGNVEYDDDYVEEETDNVEYDGGISEDDETDIGDHDGHRRRLRRQITQDGFDGVSQRELLELMLCCVQPRQDVNTVCDDLMEHYGDLRRILKGDLQEFLRFEGLGEDGAHWLDEICTLARMCCRMGPFDGVKIANFRQLHRYARRILSKNHKPCCFQLLSDGRDQLLFQRKIAPDLRWGESRCLARAADDAFSLRAKSSYLLVFTDAPGKHPSEYDLQSLRNYSLLLEHSSCTPRDILFMNEEHCVSLSRMRMMNDLVQAARRRAVSIAEDEDLPAPPGGLILHRIRDELI